MKTDKLEIYDMPGHLIRRCHQISVALFMAECESFGVTPIQFAALSALKAFPGEDQAAIAGRVAIDRSTTGNVVSRLEERGFLRRDPDKNDRRVKRLTLTKKGVDLLEKISPVVAHAQDTILAPLDPDEQAVMIKLMQKIAEKNNSLSRVPLSKDASQSSDS